MQQYLQRFGISQLYRLGLSVVAFLLILHVAGRDVLAADWPQWRYDAQRSGSTPDALPAELHLNWVRQLPPVDPAWPDQSKLDFDDHYEPVVADGRVFIGSSKNDRLTAYSTETGEELWHYQTDGPVRFPAAVDSGRVYFCSDDGHLYCVSASDGELIWKFRGGPGTRRILGNGRLISTWPARGAPVIADGTVYFAASIWPFMGVFIHALDAENGEVIWTNDGTGSIFIQQPHDSNSFAGVAPQGPLVVTGDKLLVPGGRSVAACFDRATGELLHYRLADAKRIGGWRVAANNQFFFNGGYIFDLATGDALKAVREPLVFDAECLYGASTFGGKYDVYSLEDAKIVSEEKKDRRGRVEKIRELNIEELAEIEAPGGLALLKAGNRLYGGTIDQVVVVELAEDRRGGEVVWQAAIDGEPVSMLAADDRLFVVTKEGGLYCFGAEQRDATVYFAEELVLEPDGSLHDEVAGILNETGTRRGYAICWGVGSGQLILELLDQSELNLIVLDPDAGNVARWRDRLIAAGLYGKRIAAMVADPLTFELPPYMASLIVSENIAAAGFDATPEHMQRLFYPLRPYGGVAVLGLPKSMDVQITGLVETSELENASVERVGEHLLISRNGALPGSANWTHEHADASNTRVSKDSRVKLPLGVLWFGGPTHHDILPRHGHGPQPQVVDGRLIIEGVDVIQAVDIYTGTRFWRRELKGVGEYYNFLGHQPGANATGANFISTADGVYVVHEGKCLLLDLDSGETVRTFELPTLGDGEQPADWGYINVVDDFLVAGADPLLVYTEDDGTPKKGRNENLSASKYLLVISRHSGEVLWQAKAVNYFRHNAICAGGGRLYAVDLLSEGELARLKRRGEEPTTKSRLVVFDLPSGEELWSTEDGVFGTWLSYSAKHDVLVESGRGGRDTLLDEPRGMRAFRASDGSLLWKAEHRGPAMIHGERILNQNEAFELLTGEPVMRFDPLTGQPVPWRWTRNYGCNTPMASMNLLTFRSGAAGFFDLAGDGGTGNFGGFRSGCSNNLLVAGGVLTAPDYTRTCTCAYQNQTSIALVPMNDVEIWTEFPIEDGGSLQQMGLNLGAPGFRRTEDGLLWMHEYEHADVHFDDEHGFYRHHASRVSGEFPWVTASGCRGLSRVYIDPQLGDSVEEPVMFDVTLYFADPDNDAAGKRKFDVVLQGETRDEALDIVELAGGANRTLVRKYEAVPVTNKLVIKLVAPEDTAEDPATTTILCGVAIRRSEQ